MARCQHCNKLTHSEHVIVYYDIRDYEKISELTLLTNWTSAYMYPKDDSYHHSTEFGRLKCGDIYVHFRAKNEQ